MELKLWDPQMVNHPKLSMTASLAKNLHDLAGQHCYFMIEVLTQEYLEMEFL